MARVEPSLAKHGITRLAKVTGLDRIGIPVWNAIRPNARSLSVHQGKGITDAAAKASAVMEALERSCAERPSLPTVTASAGELRSEGQLCDPLDDLVAAGHRPLDERCPVRWVTGRDLVRNETVLVPFDAILLDRTRPSHFWQSSDGLASGNTESEATLHGLLERIERDADTLWSLSRAPRQSATCLSATAIGDPVVSRLVGQIESAGFRLQLFDMTSDIGIPTISALLAPARPLERQTLRYADVTLGSGCHPMAYRAAIRAISEAVQSRITLITGVRDDVEDDVYTRPASEALLSRFQWIPADTLSPDLGSPGETHDVMLARVLERLRSRGLGRVVAVRMNPDEDSFAVVKVIVPGLEHPDGLRHRRFGPRALSKLLVF